MAMYRQPQCIVATLLAIGFSLLLGGCDSCNNDVAKRPNILFIMIDTLRADHLHSYGYQRRTSDTIDSLAEKGWLFDQHIASASQTVPSTLSLLLSQHPAEHGFRHEGVSHFTGNRPFYPDTFLFLPEVLSQAGFATAAYVSNPYLTQENGFAQGFDDFVYSHQRGESLTAAARGWLEHDWNRKRPFFVYLHYFDVHWKYDPLPEYAAKFEAPAAGRVMYSTGAPNTTMRPEDLAATVAAYDGEVAYVDDQVATLLETLATLNIEDETVIVVTSDHGDEFLDHGGLGHGTTVYGELTRVPLVIVYPDAFEPGKRIEYLTRHVDLAPTLLGLVGIDPPASFRGHSLTKAERAFAEDGPWVAVHDGRRKLVINDDTGLVQLFKAEDKRDQEPLAESDQEGRARLLEHLNWYRSIKAVPHKPHPKEWMDQQMMQLRALGYAE